MKMWISSLTLDRLVLVPDQYKQLHKLVIAVAVSNPETASHIPLPALPLV